MADFRFSTHGFAGIIIVGMAIRSGSGLLLGPKKNTF
jgi:hypothetical protein